MDPLSVSAGVGGLLGLTLQLVNITQSFVSSLIGASEKIKDFHNEVFSLCELLKRLHSDILQNEQIKTAFEQCGSAVISHATSVINSCEDI